jgi:hypothetical protein
MSRNVGVLFLSLCHIVYASQYYQKTMKKQLKNCEVEFGGEFVTLINLIDINWAYPSHTETKGPSEWLDWSDCSCVRNSHPGVHDGGGPQAAKKHEQRSPPPPCRQLTIHEVEDNVYGSQDH